MRATAAPMRRLAMVAYVPNGPIDTFRVEGRGSR